MAMASNALMRVPPPTPEGDDERMGGVGMRPDIVDETGEAHGRVPLNAGGERRWRIAPDDGESGIRHLSEYQGPDFIEEELDTIDIGGPIH
jgi:hypothetical protein